MPKIFVSHASADASEADFIKQWLSQQGFAPEAVFLDYDPRSGIAPGTQWEKEIYKAIQSSRAMLLLLTPNWFVSRWCFAEFTLARSLGKHIFPIICQPTDTPPFPPDLQHLDLTDDRHGGLVRLSRALQAIVGDPRAVLPEWDANCNPYPGMAPFAESEVRIFFGRDREVQILLEKLAVSRVAKTTTRIVIGGASGSGKSSLLRAGLLARLHIDTKTYTVLPVLRPGSNVMHDLSRALAQLPLPLSEKDWLRLTSEEHEDELHEVIRGLPGAARHVVIAIDQVEEFSSLAEPLVIEFSRVVSAITASRTATVLLAARSDFVDGLRRLDLVDDTTEFMFLSEMDVDNLTQAIVRPAQLVGVQVAPGVVAAMANDLRGRPNLPLLAMTLRHLFTLAKDSESINVAHYHALGDTKLGLNPVENIMRQVALVAIERLNPSQTEREALKETFVQHLSHVGTNGRYTRRIATWDEVPAAAHRLLEHMADRRIVEIRHEHGMRVVELVHESLLESWPLVKGWLDSKRHPLIWRGQLEQKLSSWIAHKDNDAIACDLLLWSHEIGLARELSKQFPDLKIGRFGAFVRLSERMWDIGTDLRLKGATKEAGKMLLGILLGVVALTLPFGFLLRYLENYPAYGTHLSILLSILFVIVLVAAGCLAFRQLRQIEMRREQQLHTAMRRAYRNLLEASRDDLAIIEHGA